MSLEVFFAVLFGALFHAGWNTMLKVRLDPTLVVGIIALGSSACSFPLLFIVGLPDSRATVWLLASVSIHTCYLLSLTLAYRHADITQVYPLARGSAPLLVAMFATVLLGEALTPAAWAGVVVLALGVIVMSLKHGADVPRLGRPAAVFTAITAMLIAGYSLVDGTGARVGEDPHSYTVGLFFLSGLAVAAVVLLRRRTEFVETAIVHWKHGLIGGALSVASYWIAVWAMTRAPIAMVSALRETSVLFAALFAVIWLREKVAASRIVAMCLIVSGLVIMRVA